MKRVGIAVAAIVVLALAGCGGADTFTAKGTMGLVQPDGFETTYDNTCAGTGGYDDIRGGADVVIYDADDKKVGLGELEIGAWKAGEPCLFKFKVDDIPGGDGIYSVEVAHRGQVSFKQKDAATLVLSLD